MLNKIPDRGEGVPSGEESESRPVSDVLACDTEGNVKEPWYPNLNF